NGRYGPLSVFQGSLFYYSDLLPEPQFVSSCILHTINILDSTDLSPPLCPSPLLLLQPHPNLRARPSIGQRMLGKNLRRGGTWSGRADRRTLRHWPRSCGRWRMFAPPIR
ncbi:hypothetical protein LDENG_00269720, partial [Lucifuga dentata]